MKYIISCTISILLAFSLFSQNVGIQYYGTGAGENITGTVSLKRNKIELGFGIGVNISKIRQPDDEANIYFKRLYATKPIHNMNCNFFVQRDIWNSLEKIRPYLVYDFQIKYSTTRSSSYIPYEYDSTLVVDEPEEGILYRNYINYYGPFTWVENSFGIGIHVNITDQISMNQKIGGGIHFIFGDEPILLKFSPEWEFTPFLNVGFTYKLNRKSS